MVAKIFCSGASGISRGIQLLGQHACGVHALLHHGLGNGGQTELHRLGNIVEADHRKRLRDLATEGVGGFHAGNRHNIRARHHCRHVVGGQQRERCGLARRGIQPTGLDHAQVFKRQARGGGRLHVTGEAFANNPLTGAFEALQVNRAAVTIRVEAVNDDADLAVAQVQQMLHLCASRTAIVDADKKRILYQRRVDHHERNTVLHHRQHRRVIIGQGRDNQAIHQPAQGQAAVARRLAAAHQAVVVEREQCQCDIFQLAHFTDAAQHGDGARVGKGQRQLVHHHQPDGADLARAQAAAQHIGSRVTQ